MQLNQIKIYHRNILSRLLFDIEREELEFMMTIGPSAAAKKLKGQRFSMFFKSPMDVQGSSLSQAIYTLFSDYLFNRHLIYRSIRSSVLNAHV